MKEIFEEMKHKLVVSKSRIRSQFKMPDLEYNHFEPKDLNQIVDQQIVKSLIDEYKRNHNFAIKKQRDDMGNHCFEADIFMFDTKSLKDVLEAFIFMTPQKEIDRIKTPSNSGETTKN